MVKKLLVLVILLLVNVPAFAQSVDTAWVRRYDGPGNEFDHATGLALDNSGNIYVTGSSSGSGTSADWATIKYKPNGDTAWVRRYNGPGNAGDYARAIAVDGSGNVYVTGESYDSVSFGDYATIKYYPNGDTAWVRRYNGQGNADDYVCAIAVDDSGNTYVTGGAKWSSGVYNDYVTIKYYPNGDTAWASVYNGLGNSNDGATAVAIDGFGNIYVTGGSSGGVTNQDYVTIKYRSDGDTAWVRRYDGPGSHDDGACAMVIDGSGNIYVTGQSESADAYLYRDYATIKYDSLGNEVWVRRYNGPGDGWDCPWAVTVDPSGNVYVTGDSPGNGTGDDYATIKYYPNGDTAWVRRYSGPGDDLDQAFAVAVDDSGNVYVTGLSTGGVTARDYATIKYDSSGNEVWVERYNGPGNGHDWAEAIAVDDYNNIYVTGWSGGSGSGSDYATIKYSQSTDVKDETGDRERPFEFTLSQNYPNPFNQTTKMEFTLAKSGFVSLKIYDILGRKVRTLVSEHVSPGYKSVLWNGKNGAGKDVASGIYFYQLKARDFTEAKKMLLLK